MGRFPDTNIQISKGIIRDKNLKEDLPMHCLEVNNSIPSFVNNINYRTLKNVMFQGFLHRFPLSYDHDLLWPDKEVHLFFWASSIPQMGHRQGEVEIVN